MTVRGLDPEKAVVDGKAYSSVSQRAPMASRKADAPSSKRLHKVLALLAFIILCFFRFSSFFASPRTTVARSGSLRASQEVNSYSTDNFFHTYSRVPDHICPSVVQGTPSYSGYIGLQGDSEESPRRTFYWYFEAEENHEDAPLILSFGGGPGTSGLANSMLGISHCRISENGTVANPNRWTQKYNVLAMEHPVGTGFSHSSGPSVNNSVDAAHDAYDFLQKFFTLVPHLAKNQFVITAGSYGGTYTPVLSSVIHGHNKAIARGEGLPGAIPIRLESMMISNPFSDPVRWFQWLLHYRCELHNIYNSTTCAEMYSKLPGCLDELEYALQNSTTETRVRAQQTCNEIATGDLHGTVLIDIRKKCTPENPEDHTCYPESLQWMDDFFNRNETKKALNIPEGIEFQATNLDINHAFWVYGDRIHSYHKLYEPLLADGIRLLHHVGLQDANCAYPATISFLKLLNTPFSEQFRAAPDIPWSADGKPSGTVRVSGDGGAGQFTYLTYNDAGHFVAWDQNLETKYVIEHWIENVPFV